MNFKVVENIPLSTAVVWSHCQKFKKFLTQLRQSNLTTLELKLGIIPNTVNSIAVEVFGLVKTTVNKGLTFSCIKVALS